MREIHIDLSSDNHLQQPKVFGGYAGEHKETKLVVTLPSRLLVDDISYYYFDFQTVFNEYITSPNIYKTELIDGNKITILLWEQLLPVEGNLTFCVSATQVQSDGDVILKGKTPTCYLRILKSPAGHTTAINADSTKEDLQQAIDSALQMAKDSGVFDGKDGYTPQKGVDYFTEDDITGLNIPKVDQNYMPNSTNAQSGKAVAQAVQGAGANGKYTGTQTTIANLSLDAAIDTVFNESMRLLYMVDTVDQRVNACELNYEHNTVKYKDVEQTVNAESDKPVSGVAVAAYVNNVVGDIETLLGGI